MANDNPSNENSPSQDSPGFTTVNQRLRNVGSVLGGFAKRVGTLLSEVSGQSSLPESLQNSLQKAANLRMLGDWQGASELLLKERGLHGEHDYLLLSLGLTCVGQIIIEGKQKKALNLQVLQRLEELTSQLTKRDSPPAFARLFIATQHLLAGASEKALDVLRRSHQTTKNLPKIFIDEFTLFWHLVAQRAYATRGSYERALLELRKCRILLPKNSGDSLREYIIFEGADLLLVENHLDEAVAWLHTGMTLEAGEASFAAKSRLARIFAAKGEYGEANKLLEELSQTDSAWLETSIRVALGLHNFATARTQALQYLQEDTSDWQRKRLWALAELGAWTTLQIEFPPPSVCAEIVQALQQAIHKAPEKQRIAYLQEAAHAALRLDQCTQELTQMIEAHFGEGLSTAADEFRLVITRYRLKQQISAVEDNFLQGPPIRFRSQFTFVNHLGPDEVSPLRDHNLQNRVLKSHRAFVAAEYCLQRNEVEQAQEYLVSVLGLTPEFKPAQDLLMQLVNPEQELRLEALLNSSTKLLAGLPSHILGIPLTGIQNFLTQVIAARERLVRPLTIAVMGEFSSGKSTFVNALLGEAVAPMGILPTTTTINVFRRGTNGGARIHYRDGQISTLTRNDVEPFLHSLDDVEASRIRHVEIERAGVRMGDAAIVDTPGLHALDGFHEQVAKDFIEEADAIVWIFSATSGGTGSEAGMLAQLRSDGRKVLGIVNKIDTLDEEERTELCEYLGEQFTDVLVDVVPVSAHQALNYRVQTKSPEKRNDFQPQEDSFVVIEQALEKHFLNNARELKRSLTIRRVCDALQSSQENIEDVITTLETRAEQAANADPTNFTNVRHALANFADHMHSQILDLDDLLTRECLALGVLSTKASKQNPLVNKQESVYLLSVLRDAALHRLQAAVRESSLTIPLPMFSAILVEHMVPWAQGFFDSLEASYFMSQLVQEHGRLIEQGETALRERFRSVLSPMADAWRAFARHLEQALLDATEEEKRSAIDQPRAEILRLRCTAIAQLDHLLQKFNQLQGS